MATPDTAHNTTDTVSTDETAVTSTTADTSVAETDTAAAETTATPTLEEQLAAAQAQIAAVEANRAAAAQELAAATKRLEELSPLESANRELNTRLWALQASTTHKIIDPDVAIALLGDLTKYADAAAVDTAVANLATEKPHLVIQEAPATKRTSVGTPAVDHTGGEQTKAPSFVEDLRGWLDEN